MTANSDADHIELPFYSAQVSDLVGVYMLSLTQTALSEIGGGLYRDDALLHSKLCINAELERIKGILFKLFRNVGVAIGVEMKCHRVNFLAATFSLENSYTSSSIKLMPAQNTLTLYLTFNFPLYGDFLPTRNYSIYMHPITTRL